MIITKTPHRISFFGGGSDYPEWYKYYGGKILSTTIDKYIYISIRKLPPYFGFKYRIVWSRVENNKNLSSIKHKVVKSMLPYMKIKDGMEIHYQADLPARTGLGSSSSFVVGLLNGLSEYKNIKIKKENLAKKSIYFENKVLNEYVGVQDQISASIGGLNKVLINKKGNFKIKKISLNEEKKKFFIKNLALVFTGINRTASEIAGKYVNNLRKKFSNLKEIVSHVDEGEKLLINGHFNDFGRLLNESWQFKKSLSPIISNTKVDNLYEYFKDNGALGGKLLGAGGGGFMLFYIPNHLKKKILMKNKKIKIVPFNLTDRGSEIIFKNK
tara:strand:- start:987 stop:1967 length:981 start_codon:yes stop_codon:yes gene_type:complete